MEAASAHRAADVPVFVGRAGADLVVNSSSLGAVLLNGVDVAQLFADVALLIEGAARSIPGPVMEVLVQARALSTPSAAGPVSQVYAEVVTAGSGVTLRSAATGSVKINGLDVVRAALVVRNVVQAMKGLGLSLGAHPVLDRPGIGAGAPDATAGVRRSNGDLIITTAPAGVVMINDVDILATLRGTGEGSVDLNTTPTPAPPSSPTTSDSTSAASTFEPTPTSTRSTSGPTPVPTPQPIVTPVTTAEPAIPNPSSGPTTSLATREQDCVNLLCPIDCGDVDVATTEGIAGCGWSRDAGGCIYGGRTTTSELRLPCNTAPGRGQWWLIVTGY